MIPNKLTLENHSKYLNSLIPSKYQNLINNEKVQSSYQKEFWILDKYLTDEEFERILNCLDTIFSKHS